MRPHPLLLLLCIRKQLPDVGLRLSDVLVENLGAVDNLWLLGVQHRADLSRHQGLTAAGGSVQQDSLHMLAACRQTHKHKLTSISNGQTRQMFLLINFSLLTLFVAETEQLTSLKSQKQHVSPAVCWDPHINCLMKSKEFYMSQT